MYGRGNHSTNHSPDDPGGRVNVAADMLDIEVPAAHSTPTSPAHKVSIQLYYTDYTYRTHVCAHGCGRVTIAVNIYDIEEPWEHSGILRMW